MAMSLLPAYAADYRELNKAGIAALRSGDYAQAVTCFEEALKNYSDESTHYDDGIKANLKLAQELQSGKSSGDESVLKIHAGYISKQSESTSIKGSVRSTAKILRPLPPSADRQFGDDWSLSARDSAMSALAGQRESNKPQTMRGNVVDFASRIRYLMQAATEGRATLQARVDDIEARVAALDRENSLQSRNAYVPRYIPPPTYQYSLQRSYAPYVPLLPAPDV